LLHEQSIPAEVRASSAFVAPPGVPFVGGSHLVLWRHSSQPRPALELINYLNSPEVQIPYSQEIGLFPTRLEALADERISKDAQTQGLVDRIQHGRSFRTMPLWGMLENRISEAFSNLWREVLQSNPQESDRLVSEYVIPLSRRLSRHLQQDLA
jgi:multiple sugar transport system substrate-binding protein